MYEAFYHFNRRPFVPAPDPNYYFPSETIEAARQNLLRCLQRGEGPGLVIGPSGTGKTLLCQVLAEQLRPTLAVVLLCSGRLSSRNALYQTILHGLGRPYQGMDEGELRLALTDHLSTGDDRPTALVLLVDEAQSLPLSLLDEIRMLTNLVDGGEPRVRVIMAGSPVLEERFASPKLESFSQRIVARCYLESFNRVETEQYIRAQIEAAGGDAVQLFATEASAAVYQATDGVPRLVNQVCDHSLVLAFADGDTEVNARRVEAAWADLQQLPTPWVEDMGPEGAPDIIEFGGLDEEALPEEELREAVSAGAEWLAEEQEPETKVERIEQTLSELEPTIEIEEDFEIFEPAGTIAPEIELVLEQGEEEEEPFEEFAEEEAVMPRYHEAAASEPGRAAPPVSAPPEPVESTTAGSFHEELVAADMRTVVAAVPVESVASTEDEVSIVPLRAATSVAATALPVEENIIVVEDEAAPVPIESSEATQEAVEEPAAPRLPMPRRNEYRQLFAKLRHG